MAGWPGAWQPLRLGLGSKQCPAVATNPSPVAAFHVTTVPEHELKTGWCENRRVVFVTGSVSHKFSWTPRLLATVSPLGCHAFDVALYTRLVRLTNATVAAPPTALTAAGTGRPSQPSPAHTDAALSSVRSSTP